MPEFVFRPIVSKKRAVGVVGHRRNVDELTFAYVNDRVLVENTIPGNQPAAHRHVSEVLKREAPAVYVLVALIALANKISRFLDRNGTYDPVLAVLKATPQAFVKLNQTCLQPKIVYAITASILLGEKLLGRPEDIAR